MMKIQPKAVAITCGLGFLIATLGWYFWVRKADQANVAESSQRAEGSSPTSAVRSATKAITSNGIPGEREIDQRNQAQIDAWYLTPISIYGRVVDENGSPVPEATVEIGIADNPRKTGSSYVKTTDTNGSFSLDRVHGIAFSLKASKAGYYTINASKGHRNILAPGNDETPQPTREQPVVLTLRKQENPIPLLTIKTRQVDVPRTGEPITVNLETGDTGNGELQIASWIANAEQRPFDWKYQLMIPGGGLMERSGEFEFEAPLAGYQPTVEIDMPTNAPRWSPRASKAYFAKLPNGRYARLLINLYPSQRRNFVVIESYINPSPGDRNLEFDPKKAVKPSSL
jgi:hypothetical protein